MEITNLSTNTIVCTIDNMRVHIQPGCDFQCSDTFETISFAPGQGSYSIIQAENAKILKLLSFFDDPFKLIKEYQLSVCSLFTREKICNSCRLSVTVESYYADINTRTHYDYVKVKSGEAVLRPCSVKVLEQKQIEKDFINNNSKLAKWEITWDVVLEPAVFEIAGYWVIYRIFSIWFGTGAWKVVLFFLILNVLFEVLALPFKRKKYARRKDDFLNFLNSKMIFDCCYN